MWFLFSRMDPGTAAARPVRTWLPGGMSRDGPVSSPDASQWSGITALGICRWRGTPFIHAAGVPARGESPHPSLSR